jgi:hypothetical protein
MMDNSCLLSIDHFHIVHSMHCELIYKLNTNNCTVLYIMYFKKFTLNLQQFTTINNQQQIVLSVNFN